MLILISNTHFCIDSFCIGKENLSSHFSGFKISHESVIVTIRMMWNSGLLYGNLENIIVLILKA